MGHHILLLIRVQTAVPSPRLIHQLSLLLLHLLYWSCRPFSDMSIISRLNHHHLLSLTLMVMLRASATRLLGRRKTSLFGAGCGNQHADEIFGIVIQTSTCRYVVRVLVCLLALCGRTGCCWVVRKARKGSLRRSVQACVRLNLTKILT